MAISSLITSEAPNNYVPIIPSALVARLPPRIFRGIHAPIRVFLKKACKPQRQIIKIKKGKAVVTN